MKVYNYAMPCNCGIEITGKCMTEIGLNGQMNYIGDEKIKPPMTKERALAVIELYERMLLQCDKKEVLLEAIKIAKERVKEHFG